MTEQPATGPDLTLNPTLDLESRDLQALDEVVARHALLTELHELQQDIGPDHVEALRDLFIGTLAAELAMTEEGQQQWRRALDRAENLEFDFRMRQLQARSEAIAAHAQAAAVTVDLPSDIPNETSRS